MSNVENRMKVNMIKLKFEKNVINCCDYTKDEEVDEDDDEPKKETLRRSLSASPVRAKKNLKPQIIRQISNPGKNIKRSPAFRGDRYVKTKHLNSLSKEKHLSIVDENIKKFEEKDKCDKLEIVKRKSESPVGKNDMGSQDVVDSGSPIKEKKRDDDSVKTVVISKRKNIAPLCRLDIDLKQLEISDNRRKSVELDKFLMNGVEYTKVVKPRVTNSEEKTQNELKDKSSSVKLTDSLKAALEAPLPSGPPPKKPPRTFMHGSILPLRKDKNKDISTSSSSLITSKSDPLSDEQINSSTSSSSSTKSSKSYKLNNSKKMLEKLENVLIQHKNPSKVIMPRKENSEFEHDNKKKYPVENDKSDKINFFNKISRAFDDSISKISLDRKTDSTKNSKNCLFSLNCTSSPVYDQVTFQSFTEPMQSQLKSKSESFLNSPTVTGGLTNAGEKEVMMSPASKRLFTEMSTFFDEKKQQSSFNERVYAEPFAFDQNTGTDILGYGKLASEEHNYLSRNHNKDGFNINFNQKLPDVSYKKNSKPELHYLCTPIESLVFANKNNNILKSNEDIGKLSGDKFKTYPNKSNSCPQLIKTEDNKKFKKITVDYVDSRDCENNIHRNGDEIYSKFIERRLNKEYTEKKTISY